MTAWNGILSLPHPLLFKCLCYSSWEEAEGNTVDTGVLKGKNIEMEAGIHFKRGAALNASTTGRITLLREESAVKGNRPRPGSGQGRGLRLDHALPNGIAHKACRVVNV